MTSEQTLLWTQRLLALSMTLQAAELLWVHRAFADDGVFAWSELRRDFEHTPLRRLLDLLLSHRGFVAILLGQLGLALLLPWYAHASLTALLLLTTLLVNVRFRGTYNGGSDSMTIVVLLGLMLSQAGSPRVGLGYVAAQLVLSYFLSGLSKLRSSHWRGGTALSRLVSARRYVVPASLARWLVRPWLSRYAGWLVLAFECAFPLSLLLGRQLALGLLAAGLCFHLAIALTLGLNRFFWAWLSAYPALLYWSERA